MLGSLARRLDCSLEDYRRDELGMLGYADDGLAERIDPPTLSQSIAHTLVSSSPLHAWQQHPRLGGGAHEEPTPEQDMGTLLHLLVLGKGADIVEVQADDWRTKIAKEARDVARAEGRIPVLSHKLDIAGAVSSKISTKLRERGIVIDSANSEVMLAWEEVLEHRNREYRYSAVWCRGMLDYLRIFDRDKAIVLDLKFYASANPAIIARRVIDMGLDVQAAAYTSAVEKLDPSLVGRVEYLMVVCEPRPPYALTICRLDNVLKQLGEEKWQRAVRTWAECLARNEWPGYSTDIVTLDSPAWALSALEAEVLNEAE